MKKSIFLAISFAVLFFTGCKKCNEASKTVYIDKDLLTNHVVADTITYEVIIKNSTSSEEWMNQCQQYSDISHFNKNAFIDSLFAGIYAKKYSVYDFFSGKAISTVELATLEKEEWFSRDAIGKIQFKETWYYDEQNQIFRKKVISMILGVELVDDLGALKGYKAIFKMNLN